ncbi:MAG TPA: bile acid:sodium symporter family protein [Pseudohaliea sp.]|nr:bile acid:sodium symporter family protein [Pseudohaliea sp.]HKL62302.1 bile acid:sodium symporter family protein [Woeseiaceae bacterium]
MNPVLSTLLPAGLAFIMFALGLRLSVADFRRVLTYPTAVGLGLAAQTLLLPVTAFGITALFDLSPEAAVGLMILAACPGGVTAAMITNLARGDTALSVTLTACTSLLSFVTVPVIVGLSLQHFLGQAAPVDYPMGQAIGSLFLITLLPVAGGLAFNERGWLAPGAAEAIGKVATAVFLVIVFATFYTEWPSITEHFAKVGPAILLLNVATMATGALLGVIGRLPTAGRIALAVECGIQNSALGITVAVSLLSVSGLAVPSVIYAFLMNITALGLIVVRQLQVARAAGNGAY